MTKFVTKIQDLPIASDRAKADIAGNSIVDTYATKSEGSMVSVSEGQTQGYLSDVLKAGDGITLTESDGAITASANIKILQYGKAITSDKWKDLHNKIAAGEISLFCKRNAELYPLLSSTNTDIIFGGLDIASDYSSKSRKLILQSGGTWSESAWFMLPANNYAIRTIRNAIGGGTKILSEKTSDYWTGYWVPIFSVPIGRFNFTLQLFDNSSAYNANITANFLGIDKDWMTVSFTCLNPATQILRVWKDGTRWYIGVSGEGLSKSLHTFEFRLVSVLPLSFEIVSNETRLDPSTLDISGVHLQKPVANTSPDWDQSPVSTSDSSELNPDQGSTELS